MKISKETIARTAVLFFALLNQILTMFGKNPLPFSEDQAYLGVATVITVAATVWAWWKNNSFSKNAIKADELLKELNAQDDKEDN